MIGICPRCDYEIPEARRGFGECPKCRVIFDRYDPDRPRMRPLGSVAKEPEPSGPPVALILVVLFVVLGILFLLRPQSPDQAATAAPSPADVAPAVAASSDDGAPAETATDPEATPAGLTAADLLADPDLTTYGDGSALSQTLTPSQLAEARATLEAEAEQLRVEIGPVVDDPMAEEPPADLQTTTIDEVGDLAWVGWYEGAEGYTRAAGQAQSMGRPLVVYFHTDWCQWCARFDEEFLPDPLVRRFLSNVIRVHVNPERGDAELDLSRRYGVAGYPTFLVIPPNGGVEGAVRVHPFRDGGTISTADFVAECETAAGRS